MRSRIQLRQSLRIVLPTLEIQLDRYNPAFKMWGCTGSGLSVIL